MTKTVLVTGASGFVAAHVLEVFLSAGYHVRAAVRNDASADKVRSTHGQYGDALTFTIVPDMSVAGAFDEAVKGVDGVIHTASPFVLDAKDYDKDLFTPAVNGTLFVLQAAAAYGPTVKRVVVTSSFASVINYNKGNNPGYVYDEKDWNPMPIEEARKSDPTAAYLASKTFAEHAAFDFVEKEKPNFNVTTICPPMVYGPVEHAVKSMKALNTSSGDFWRLINGTSTSVPGNGFYAYADVRDLATAHLLAFESEKAAGERYLVTNGPYTYQQFVNIVREKFPELRDSTPEGNPNEEFPDVYRIDNSKAIKELGLKYRTMEEMVVDTVNSLKALETKLGA